MSLSLSRRRHESIRLHTSDGDITVTIADSRNGVVRLAINAPASVRIMRTELEEAVGLMERSLREAAKKTEPAAVLERHGEGA